MFRVSCRVAPVNNRSTLAEDTRLPDATTPLIATSAPTDTTGAVVDAWTLTIAEHPAWWLATTCA